ncbi:hypothetical protein ABBQ38_013560 [Trebouxia sp. C0009 RCD-2024]
MLQLARLLRCLLCGSVLVRAATAQTPGTTWTTAKKAQWRQTALEVFQHGYDNYMLHAFPHDELKPISQDYTDSLGEFGNPNPPQCQKGYQGVALTLIDSLSTLAVLGNKTEFEKGVWFVVDEVSFDVDLKVNVFEANIRLLGGLLSAHLLASDPELGLMQKPYQEQLLTQATDLGDRLLATFDASPTDIPYAWVNLRHGMGPEELAVQETNTAAVGSYTLEFGLLSRLTGDPKYEEAAVAALAQLWSMRSPLDLVGTSIDAARGRWNNRLGGTGAGADSFYEYLLKAYVLFGQQEYWDMFRDSYRAVMRHYRSGAWYDDADIGNGRTVHQQFQSLQAFWPGMQVLAGDLLSAQESYWHYFALWQAFGALPERFLYGHGQLHSSQQQYPLRPELMESTFHLYQATQDTRYLDAGAAIIQALIQSNWVEGGWASVQSVHSMQLEDHMPSYFLAEACKYLFLLFDDSFFKGKNYIFTTEGHVIPVLKQFHNAEAAPAQLRQMAQLRPTPLQSPQPVQTVMLTPDQPQLWQLFESVRQHFSSPSAGNPGASRSAEALNAATQKAVVDSVRAAVVDSNDAALLQQQQQEGDALECPAPQQSQGSTDRRRRQTESAIDAPQVSTRDGAIEVVSQANGRDAAQSLVQGDATIKHKTHQRPVDSCVPERADALAQRTCPVFGHPAVQQLSLCHLLDIHDDHSCRTRADCGVDSVTCRVRECSVHAYCQEVAR